MDGAQVLLVGLAIAAVLHRRFECPNTSPETDTWLLSAPLLKVQLLVV